MSWRDLSADCVWNKLYALNLSLRLKFLGFPSFFFNVQDLAEKTRIYLPHNELLESVKRLALRRLFPSSSDQKVFFSSFVYFWLCSNLEESNVDNVSVDSLISLEDQLETALSATRARKVHMLLRREWTYYYIIFCLGSFLRPCLT